MSSRFVEEIYSGSIRGGSGLRGLRECVLIEQDLVFSSPFFGGYIFGSSPASLDMSPPRGKAWSAEGFRDSGFIVKGFRSLRASGG